MLLEFQKIFQKKIDLKRFQVVKDSMKMKSVIFTLE